MKTEPEEVEVKVEFTMTMENKLFKLFKKKKCNINEIIKGFMEDEGREYLEEYNAEYYDSET